MPIKKYWYNVARTSEMGIASSTASQVFELGVLRNATKIRVQSAYVVTSDTITGDTTNYCTLILKNKTLNQNVCSKAFTFGVNASPLAATSMGAVSNNVIQPGSVVTLQKTVGGSGLATPSLAVVIEYTRA